MKSEQRHKLETNYLADHLGDSISKIKPYTNVILGGIILVFLAGIVFAYMQNTSARKNAEAWNEMFLADGDADQLTRVYEDFENTAAAPWARQRQADSQLARAIDQVYVDKDQAMELLKQAKENYEAVLDKSYDPLLRSRATLGIAKVCETEGDAEAAVMHYRKLLTMDLENKALESEVNRRIGWLESDDSKGFMVWYKSFQPTKAAPIGLPSNLNQIPSGPDMTLPEYKPTGIGVPPAANAPEAIATPPIINPPGTESTEPKLEAPPAVDPNASAAPVDLQTPTANPPVAPPVIPPATPVESGGTKDSSNGGGQ